MFDRVFAGVKFAKTDGPLLYVYSRDEQTAAEIEDDFSLLIADVASRILNREVERVVVLPKVLQYRSAAPMPKMRRKSELPQKICAACGRPFARRRKWAKDWAEVKTCSDRCKRGLRRNGKFGRRISDPGRHALFEGCDAVPGPLRR